MHWVIQEAVVSEPRYQDMVDTLIRFNIPYTLVKVVPFAHTLEPDVEIDGPVIVMGTVSLASKIVERKGWKPGAFTNENFDFRVWREKWKGHILNEDAIVTPFRRIPLTWDPFFIRPVLDNKAFTGQLMWMHDFQTWMGRLLVEEGASDLNFDIDEIVMTASPKDIYREMRFFIVNEKIVTASVYKIGEDITYQDEGFVDEDAYTFVKSLITPMAVDSWVPDRAFVLDVALTEDGYKVIEVNCINSAGLYHADVQKLIMALNSVHD